MMDTLNVSIALTETLHRRTKPRKRGFVLLIESFHKGNVFIKFDTLDQLKYDLYQHGLSKLLKDHNLKYHRKILKNNNGEYLLNDQIVFDGLEINFDPDYEFVVTRVAEKLKVKYHISSVIDELKSVLGLSKVMQEEFIRCLQDGHVLTDAEWGNLVDLVYNEKFPKTSRADFTRNKKYNTTILIREGKEGQMMKREQLPLQGKLLEDMPGTIRSERDGKVYVHKVSDPEGIPLAVEYPDGQVYMPNSMHYSGGRQTPPVQLTSDDIDLMDVSAMYPTQIKDILKDK